MAKPSTANEIYIRFINKVNRFLAGEHVRQGSSLSAFLSDILLSI
jgi:hypothetical protein